MGEPEQLVSWKPRKEGEAHSVREDWKLSVELTHMEVMIELGDREWLVLQQVGGRKWKHECR